MAKTVKVLLRNSLGIRQRGASRARYYGPGVVDMDINDAIALGAVDADGKVKAQFAPQKADTDEEEVDATDEARALAEAHGIDLSTVQGTGANGRILKKDVEAAIPSEEGEGEE